MNKKVLIGILLAIIAGLYAYEEKLAEMDIGWAFVLFLVGGLILGIFLVKNYLPGIGDSISALVLAGGGHMTKEEIESAGRSPKAIAMVARGDFKGALREYEMTLHKNPQDLHAMAEISKIQAEHLAQPELAVDFLRTQISNRPWTIDEEVFMLFRIADIHRNVQHDRLRSEDILEQIMARFPKTRHSANAREKLEKWRVEDTREDQVQRRKAELGK